MARVNVANATVQTCDEVLRGKKFHDTTEAASVDVRVAHLPDSRLPLRIQNGTLLQQNSNSSSSISNALRFGVVLSLQSPKKQQHRSSATTTRRFVSSTISRTPLLLLIASIVLLLGYTTTTTLITTVQATLTGSTLGTVGQGIKIVLPDQSGVRPETALESQTPTRVRSSSFNSDDAETNEVSSDTLSDGDMIDSRSAALISQLLSGGGGGNGRQDREQVLEEFLHKTSHSAAPASFKEARSLINNMRDKKSRAREQWHASRLGRFLQNGNENKLRNKRAAMVMPVETYGPTSSGAASLLSGRRNRNEPIGYPGCGIQHYKPNYIMQAASADARDVALRSAPPTTTTTTTNLPNPSLRTHMSKRRVEAKQNSWPWQADLFFYRTMPDGSKQRAHLCGATLIDRWHVVTAAHCNISRLAQPLFGEVPSEYYVRLGQHKRSAATADHVQEIRVKHWRDHELFNDSVTYAKSGEMQFFLYNDIAFLTLERPANLSPEVYPICLDFNEQPVFDVGATCYASGWSLDEFDYEKWLRGDYSDVLNESKSKIADGDYCRKHHGGFNETVTLCTKYAQGHYSCHGDSGGPLQCESNGRFFLVGIVSYDVATSCRETGMTFFSRISGLQAWIEARLVEDMLSL